jgi:hypothetical protein
LTSAVVDIETGEEIVWAVDLAVVRPRDYTGWGGCYADNGNPMLKTKLCQGLVKYETGRGICLVCRVISCLVEPDDDEVF